MSWRIPLDYTCCSPFCIIICTWGGASIGYIRCCTPRRYQYCRFCEYMNNYENHYFFELPKLLLFLVENWSKINGWWSSCCSLRPWTMQHRYPHYGGLLRCFCTPCLRDPGSRAQVGSSRFWLLGTRKQDVLHHQQLLTEQKIIFRILNRACTMGVRQQI